MKVMKYNEAWLLKVKDALQEMKVKIPVHCGICYNLIHKVESPIGHPDCYAFVRDECVGWMGIEYPTSFPVDDIIFEHYPEHRFSGRWEGKDLELRLSLIDHLISVCDKYLQEEQ